VNGLLNPLAICTVFDILGQVALRRSPVLEFRNISWWLKSLDLISQTGYLTLLRHFSPEMV
jgi:hypothetical protein